MRARGPVPWTRRVLAGTLLAAVVYAAFLAFTDVQNLRAVLDGLPLLAILGALGLVLAGYGIRAVRWHLYLRRLGARMPVGTEFLVFLSGFAMAVTPGKAGELVKAHYLREASSASYDAGVPAVLAERASDTLSVALLVAIGSFFVPRIGPAPGLAVLGLVGLAIALLRWRAPARRLLALLDRGRFRGTAHALGAMHANLRSLLGGGLLLWGTLLGLMGWALEVAAMDVLASGLGIHLGWGPLAFVFAAGTLAGVLTFLPGGVGATEGGMVALLVLLGTPYAPATALTLAIRLCTLWFAVALGVLAIMALGRRRKGTEAAEASAG